jgi:hypothetical protein
MTSVQLRPPGSDFEMRAVTLLMLVQALGHSADTRFEWRSLFDGSTWANWSLSKLKESTWWKIEDGWIHSIPEGTSREGRRLVTLESFRDFDLQFEWKVAQSGNSGVKYRIQRVWSGTSSSDVSATSVPPVKPTLDGLMTATALGFEYQLADDENEPAAISTPLALTAALYGLLAPRGTSPAKAGVVHSSRIIVKGSHFEHWLDKRKLLEGDLRSAKVMTALRHKRDAGLAQSQNTQPRQRYEGVLLQVTAESLLRYDVPESPIDFQHHRSWIAFRNIRIRRL